MLPLQGHNYSSCLQNKKSTKYFLGSTDYSTHIDMWGVGCILYEMAKMRPLFTSVSREEQLGFIFRYFSSRKSDLKTKFSTLGAPDPDRHPTICNSPEYSNFVRQWLVTSALNETL